jgi:branched-subunit amino acid aminotransferase/4-amino-4-deoxychorismate lyase
VNPAPRAWLSADGGWQPASGLPLTDRGTRYGMAVFETIGVHGGRALFAAEHLDLLATSARELLQVTPPEDLPALGPTDTGILRIYITAGDGGPTDPVDSPRIFALFEATGRAALPPFQTARLHPDPVAPFARGRKTGNYWMNCAAQAEAQAAGFDHALLADHAGCALSAAFGNLFFVLGGELCTPSAGLAVRPGVVRGRLLRELGAREVEFPAARLGEVSEIFLTNSRLGVMPLELGPIGPGPVGCAWRDLFRSEPAIP